MVSTFVLDKILFPYVHGVEMVYNLFQDLWNWFIILEGG